MLLVLAIAPPVPGQTGAAPPTFTAGTDYVTFTLAYLLAYAPTPVDRDGKSHTMEAQVKGIGNVVTRTFRLDRR